MVSICTSAPGCVASGRGGYFRVLAHALLRFRGAQYVPTIRFTLESDIKTPSFFRSACTTMAQRRTSRRLAITRATSSGASARGEVFGTGGSFSMCFLWLHFTMAPCVYPRCRATLRVLHPFANSSRARRLTSGSLGFVVYAICLGGDSKVLNHYVGLTF